MRIDVHVHQDEDENRGSHAILLLIQKRIEQLFKQGSVIMAKVDELQQELGEINSATNDIADDIDKLVAAVPAEGGLTKEEADNIKSQLTALKDRLTGIASQYPPVVTDPPADPPTEGFRSRR